jgi:hypothetical protein
LVRALWKEALSEQGPFVNAPNGKAPDGLPQERDVIGHQQQAQRQHPYSEERQDRENPPEDEENADGQPDPLGRRMAKVPENPRDLAGHFVFQVPERLSQNSSAAKGSHAF